MQKTFEELALMWSENKQSIVKYSTLCAYRLTLRTHLIPHFGAMTEIEEAEVQLDYPTTESGRKLPVLSLRHQRKLMKHLMEQPNARNIGVMLALCTGMRIGEVCALKWEDVDLTHRMIRVCKTVGRIYNCELGATERVFSTPKTKHSFREIPISKLLFEALCVTKRMSSSPFVVGTTIYATDPRTYRDYFNLLLKRLNITPIVFHGLRHTFATRCIESQCDYKTVSSILGHSNVATTLNLYVHPNLQQKKRCIDKMSKFVEGKP